MEPQICCPKRDNFAPDFTDFLLSILKIRSSSLCQSLKNKQKKFGSFDGRNI